MIEHGPCYRPLQAQTAGQTGPAVMIATIFAEITIKILRLGVHRSVTALETDIRGWIKQWNTNPKPYVWTRTADQISNHATALSATRSISTQVVVTPSCRSMPRALVRRSSRQIR